ncbi:MAG: hypothetical protein M3Z20_02130 [Chloroflexota bacterium]|nr:hypothetical protein [Chloroflexota bacterium]
MNSYDWSRRVHKAKRQARLGRTAADLAWAEQIATAHIAEALQYQPRVAEG